MAVVEPSLRVLYIVVSGDTRSLLESERRCQRTVGQVATDVVIAVALHLTSISTFRSRSICRDSRLADTHQSRLIRGKSNRIVAHRRFSYHDGRRSGANTIIIAAGDRIRHCDVDSGAIDKNAHTVCRSRDLVEHPVHCG